MPFILKYRRWPCAPLLVVYLLLLMQPFAASAQQVNCPFDRENPSIDNARMQFKVTNYTCAEEELNALLAQESLDLKTKADAHVLLAQVYYAKLRDSEDMEKKVVAEFVAAFRAYKNWKGDLDIQSSEFVALMKMAQDQIAAEEADKEGTSIDLASEQVPSEEGAGLEAKKKPWYKKWYVLGLGAVVVGSAALMIGGSGGGDNGETPTTDLPDFPSVPGK